MLHSLEGRAIIEILRDPHVAVERHVFWHVAEMRPRLERLLKNVVSSDGSAPRSRRHKASENAHGRCFTCAVWPQKSHDFALVDLETQILNGRLAGVTLCQIFNRNHCAIFR